MNRGRKLGKVAIYAGLVVILVVLPLFIKSPYWIHMFNITLIYIIATSSLRFIALSGQISLGHAGFMSIGAYTSAIVAIQLGWTPWVTIPLGGVAAMTFGILVGYPFSRLRAIYFSMVSLFCGLGILAVNSVFQRFTGGFTGLVGMPPLFGASKVPYYYFFLGLTLLCLLALYRLEFCRIGTTLKAIDQSYRVASSVGINESGYRVFAMAIGCFFVGIAGGSYAHYSPMMSHSSFNLLASINLIVYMLVGGINSFAGPIIGTAVLILIPELFRTLKEFVPFIYASIMLVVVFVIPDGLAGLPQLLKSRFIERRGGKGGSHGS